MSSTLCVRTRSVDGTVRIGQLFGTALRKGDIVLMTGDLGAGKTHFTKGIGASFGLAADRIVSPTFTIVCEYRGGSVPLFHMDIYRLGGFEELLDIGFEEYASEGVCVIEWAENAPELFDLEARIFSVKITRTECRDEAPDAYGDEDNAFDLSDAADNGERLIEIKCLREGN